LPKIIGKELTVNPKAVTDIVAQTIEAANVQGSGCIRVNPQDYEILGPLWDAIPSLQPSGRTWELVADKNITRGSCLIETNGGIIDARLETQLAQVSAAIETIDIGNTTN
jgi:flagellar biosynthesis/type III secretory pathway protein FliH